MAIEDFPVSRSYALGLTASSRQIWTRISRLASTAADAQRRFWQGNQRHRSGWMGWSWRIRRVKPKSCRSGSPSTAGSSSSSLAPGSPPTEVSSPTRTSTTPLGLTRTGVSAPVEGRRGANIRHRLLGLLRQAVYGRLAGYEHVNHAERLARDPAMRAIVERDSVDQLAASSNGMRQFSLD
jgi:hypothetical protein